MLVAAAMVLAAVAAVARTHGLGPAASATAGPFLTLAAIITLGILADRVGVFRWLARILVPKHSSAVVAFAALLILTALLSGLINLDVAVVVAMPVGLGVASRVRSGARWIGVAIAVTANSASFLLPTSNLTNLLVLTGAPLTVLAYIRDAWLAWLLVMGLTLFPLVWLLGHDRNDRVLAPPTDHGAQVGMVLDLLPMFVAATAIRTLIGSGLVLHGNFTRQAAGGSLLAAGVNNLPAAAAVHATKAGRWALVLGLAVGPNLILWGSVATLICRRIAREGGADLPLVRFSLIGGCLLPLQLAAAWLGLHLTGAL